MEAIDYDKEIKKAQEKVKRLQEEKQQAFIESLPDITGKYFMAAWKTFYKILDVVDAEEEDEIYCDVFYVSINENDTQASIKSYEGYVGVRLKDEISEEEFMKWYTKARDIISNRI